MRTSSVLVDTDKNIFVCRCFSLLSNIHRSMTYAYHHKYLNIVNVQKLRQFPLFKKRPVYVYLNSIFRNVQRDIFVLYTFIMYICWYMNCLLYIYSFSLIANMSLVSLYYSIYGSQSLIYVYRSSTLVAITSTLLLITCSSRLKLSIY